MTDELREEGIVRDTISEIQAYPQRKRLETWRKSEL